jgi:KaiC/GvpD/RAD55 family RecA-like ATPase
MPDLPPKLLEMARRPERNTASDAGEISPEQLARSLEHLDPTEFRDHDKWRELMMACHHATDGEGRQEFIDWSTSDPAYADHEWLVGRRWDSLHSDRDDAVTIATLRKHLIEAGADVEPSDPEDDFDVWEEDAEPAQPQRRRKFITMDELEALPPPKWLIPGVLTEGSLAAIYGAPESGKSFLAVDMSMAVAGGMSWHGRTVERGAVLYIAAEGAPGLGKRVRAWKVEHRAQGREFSFWLDRDELNLAAEKDGGVRAFVREVVEALGPLKLVIIDTLNQTAAGADENSAKDMGRYISSMKRLRDETGATVVVVHHSGKDASKGMRGSTALLGAMDTTVEVERDKDGRAITVRVQKQKDAEREGPMRFNLEKADKSLVLRPTVMTDEATPSDGLLALACELGATAGTLKAADLTDAAIKRLGLSKSSAQRAVADKVPEGRIDAVRAAWDGRHFWLWCERIGKHSTAPKVVRVEAAV